MRGIFLLAEELLSYEDGPSSLGLVYQTRMLP